MGKVYKDVQDLTIVYYTANVISDFFMKNVQGQITIAAPGVPIVSVSHKPIAFGENIVVALPRHHLSIYKQALIGAREAKTKYIALCEDDVLYSPEHFKFRPKSGTFGYNLGTWNMFTWGEPIFNHKERRNMSGLVCERDLFIEAMEERFRRWPDDSKIDLSHWAEPSKYEHYLKVKAQTPQFFHTNPPNIVFTHQTALSYDNLGKRKKLGEIRAYSIPYWGIAEDIRALYD